MNFIVGAALLLMVASAFATDYCRSDLCPNGKTHIACRNKGEWGPDCRRTGTFHVLTPSDKEMILDMHNRHREEIASGRLSPKYFKASNMKQLIWDDELAHVACYNAIRCKMYHDECRNTDDAPYAGQNLAITGTSPKWLTFEEAYRSLHTKWYIEHNDCNMAHIRQYPKSFPKAIGHFTQIVSDKADKIGCCVSKFINEKGMNTYYIVCNYSYTNVANQPIYLAGNPACRRFSSRYPNLCAPGY